MLWMLLAAVVTLGELAAAELTKLGATALKCVDEPWLCQRYGSSLAFLLYMRHVSICRRKMFDFQVKDMSLADLVHKKLAFAKHKCLTLASRKVMALASHSRVSTQFCPFT